MNYFDPNRDYLGNGLPTLLGFTSVIPQFELVFVHEQAVEITVWPPADRANSFSAKSTVIQLDHLLAFIRCYLENPEEILREVFEWVPPTEKKAASQTITLEDIGL